MRYFLRRISNNLPSSRPSNAGTAELILSLWLLSVSALFAKSSPSFSHLCGTVRDAAGAPIANNSVYLEGRASTRTVLTDSSGNYCFRSVPAGVYGIRSAINHSQGTLGLFVVPVVPNRQLGLTLLPQNQAQTTHVSSEPEFFDKPQFEVAGVTDTTNLGGHGSDVAVRTTDTLAKQTSQLRNSSAAEPASTTRSAVGDSAGEQDFESYLSSGKALLSRDLPKQATDPLEKAFQLNPKSTEAAFELAHADLLSGRYQRARINLLSLASRQESAPVVELLAETYERLNDPLAASRNYQRAAELQPSETNLFHWGSELLLHHAAEPAADVFTSGNRLFPHSTRMLIGLAVARYALGLHEEAVTSLCSASNLDPNDSQPYLFLGRIQATESVIAPCSIATLERFETLQPQNAFAKYYLAIALMKQAHETADPALTKAEDLLLKSVALQPKFDLGYLALGDLYSRRRQLAKAISALQKATAANPDSSEAHYRLSQLYRTTNHIHESNRELQEYKQLSAKSAEQLDKERHELPQLVYELQSQSKKEPR